MKSLKRTLCLVLALVMVLGLFGVASAAKFPDDNTIQYKEAVDVMTGIGAINGQGDGNFNPKGDITRAEAAKLVTYTMLGEASAKKLSAASSSFSDVTAANYAWAIPSIEYLVKEGVINGRGDGTFDPDGKITGYELGKMLLCALGYGAKDEYVGRQWDLNVAIDGNRLGHAWDGDAVDGADGSATPARRLAVFSNRADDANALSSAATREEAALYCFNTIQKSKVEYVSSLDVYASSGDFGMNIENIATEVYPGLTRDAASKTDNYGRPATEWTYGSATNIISSASDKPILTYTTAMKADAVNLAIKNAGYTTTANYTISKNNEDITTNTTKIADSDFGNGILVEIYGDPATKAVTKVVKVETNIGVVQSVTDDDPKTTKIDERSFIINVGNTAYYIASAEDKTEGFDAVYTVAKTLKDAGELDKASVLFVYDGDDSAKDASSVVNAKKVLSVSVPKTVETKVTSTKKDTGGSTVISFTSEAGNYELAKQATTQATGIDVGDTATFILDNYGYVIHAGEASEAAKSVGIIVAAGYGNDGFNDSYKLKIVTLDGKETVLPVANATPFRKLSGSSWVPDDQGDQSSAGDLSINKAGLDTYKGIGYIVTYETDPDSEGNFIVKAASAKPVDGSTDKLNVVNKKVDLTNDGGTVVKANEQTVFVVKTTDTKGTPTYTPYVGIGAVPSMTSEKLTKEGDASTVFAPGKYAFAPNTKLEGYASVVYLDGAKLTEAPTSSLSFIVADTSKTIKLSNGTQVYDGALITGGTYGDITPVQVKTTGVLTTMTVQGQTVPNPVRLVQSYTLKDGIITAATPFTTPTSTAQPGNATGTVKAANGVITLGTTGHTYDPKCIVWEIDATQTETTKKFVPKAVTGIGTDNNDTVVFVEHPTTGTVSAIYILKQTGGEGVAPVAKKTATANITGTGATGLKWDVTQDKLDGTPSFSAISVTPTKDNTDSGTPSFTYEWTMTKGTDTAKAVAGTGNTSSYTPEDGDFDGVGSYVFTVTISADGYNNLTKSVTIEVTAK